MAVKKIPLYIFYTNKNIMCIFRKEKFLWKSKIHLLKEFVRDEKWDEGTKAGDSEELCAVPRLQPIAQKTKQSLKGEIFARSTFS